MQYSVIQERTIALAGIFQAIQQVQNIARKNICDSAVLATSIKATLNMQPENTIAVYGDIKNLYSGLELIGFQLKHMRDPLTFELNRYLIGVMTQESYLRRSKEMQSVLAVRIKQTLRQSEHYDVMHDSVLNSLAELYQDTLSKLSYRMNIFGEESFLMIGQNQERIRALLLSAVRSAVLWRQLGGRRWQFIFSKRKMLDSAKELLLLAE